MKKFSVNLLKVGVLLIMGLCIMGAMSQVNASENEVRVHYMIREPKIYLTMERKEDFLTINEEIKANIEKKENLVIITTLVDEPDYEIPADMYEVVGFKSLNEDIVTVTQEGMVTALKEGTATIRYEIKVKIDEGYGIFYDEAEVEVESIEEVDDSEPEEDFSNPENGDDFINSETEGENLLGQILKMMFDILNKILEILIPLLKEITPVIIDGVSELVTNIK